MTGYLITGSLLRERDRSEARGGPWKLEALRIYQIRRGLRILAPYYAALALALLVSADVRQALGWYVFHLSNIHMALLGDWPDGTNHFWSLSMQQQFYLVWPFVLWFVPRNRLVWAILLFSAIGPVSRSFHDELTAWFAWPQVMTWASLDYFGIGGLLALAVHRGMSLESPALRWISIAAFGGYIAVFGSHALGWPTFGLRSIQQTLLSISLCGLIAAATVGFPGMAGRLLEQAVSPAHRPGFLRDLSVSQPRSAVCRQALLVSLGRILSSGSLAFRAHRDLRRADVVSRARLVAVDRAAAARSALEAGEQNIATAGHPVGESLQRSRSSRLPEICAGPGRGGVHHPPRTL